MTPKRLPGAEALVRGHVDALMARLPVLKPMEGQLWAAYGRMADSFEAGGKLLVCGNGGSAADADHVVGELMKGFLKKRPLPDETRRAIGPLADGLQQALPTICLTQHTALSTAYSNDVDPALGFAQQVYGYGRPGDCFLGISTSGNAANVCAAAQVAAARGLHTIGLTGRAGGRLNTISGVCLCVPADETYLIQELHLPLYHCLCSMLEETFFAA